MWGPMRSNRQKLGLPLDHVSTVGTRLKVGGIWIGDHVAHAGRWAECVTTFLMDVLVASGVFKCFHDGREPKYIARRQSEAGRVLS
jgi:hypothetical protein